MYERLALGRICNLLGIRAESTSRPMGSFQLAHTDRFIQISPGLWRNPIFDFRHRQVGKRFLLVVAGGQQALYGCERGVGLRSMGFSTVPIFVFY